MNYTLHQLRVFVKVAELQSITKAAEELYLTQPAVSIQLKKLQDQFEIPLTEVIGRQLYVTDFGKQIMQVSEKILKEAEILKSTIAQYKGLLTGKISFSIVSTAKYVLPYFLKGFTLDYPEVEMRIDVTNKNRVIESLVHNETDFALISVLPGDLPLETVEFMDNHLFLVGASRFHEQKKLKLDEIPLIFREKGSATRKAMEDYLQKRDIKYNKRLELVSNEAVKQSILAGLGYSIMPLIGLKNELLSGAMEIIPQKGLPIVTRWYLVYNKGKRLTPASEEFIRYVQEHKSEIIETSFGWETQFTG